MGLGEASNLVKTVFMSVKEGNWWMAAGALLVLVVGLLRGIGRKFHEWLPDNNIMDKPLIFLYDTKIGGWVLNWLTATAGGIATAMAAGVTVDWSLWKSVLMVSTSGTALFELYSDIKEWWVARQEAKKKAAEEEAAKKAALVSTPPTDVQKS
jgi:beta-glucanase (GH16 family)